MRVIGAYIIFFIIVFVIFAIVVAYKLLQVRNHETQMAMFYKKNHITNDDVSTIRKRFKKNRELLEETEREYEKEKKADYLYHESKRKKAIAKRIFAYDYEDMLYQIYAPVAKKYLKWSASGVALEKSYIIQRISEIKNVSRIDAESIFNILADHELICEYGPGKYFMTTMLEENSNVLEHNFEAWNVISDSDMNLDKWMVEHDYERKQ